MNKQEDSRQTAKAALFNTIANVIALVVGMVMVPVITRVISAEDLGIASTFLSTRNILVIVVTLAVYAYVNRAMLEYKDNKKDYVFTLVGFCIVTVIISFLVCLPWKEGIQKILSMDDFLFYWLFVSMFSIALYNIGYNYCAFHNKYMIVSTIVLMTGPAAQVLALVLSYVMPKHKYIGRVIGLDFVYMIVTVCVLIWMVVGRKGHFQKEYLKHTLTFTVPIIPHMLSQMVLTQCDLIMINYFSGGEEAGIYSMAHTIGYLAFTVMTQIMAIWSPWVYRRLEEKDYTYVYQNANMIMLIASYITMGLLTVAPELIKIFLTKEYLPCIYIVPPLVVGMFFQIMYMFFYDVEYYYKKAKAIAIFSVISCLVNVGLNYVLIPKFGYMAASYTTVVSYLLLMLLSGAYALKLGGAKIYNLKYMFAANAAVTAYAVMAVVWTEQVILRYGILVALTGILLIKEYDKIKAFLVSMKGGKRENT